MRTNSPSLSAVRSSPLSSGSLASYPATASPFQSSPGLSFVESRPQSPDLFEPLEYTPDLGTDLHRIDLESMALVGDVGILPQSTARVLVPETPPKSTPRVLVPETPLPTFPQDGKTWVVFLGKVPGLYNTV